jgi:hypothetical protein
VSLGNGTAVEAVATGTASGLRVDLSFIVGVAVTDVTVLLITTHDSSNALVQILDAAALFAAGVNNATGSGRLLLAPTSQEPSTTRLLQLSVADLITEFTVLIQLPLTTSGLSGSSTGKCCGIPRVLHQTTSFFRRKRHVFLITGGYSHCPSASCHYRHC